ncbi:AbrB/MazE/SpoVT family DNA-binding domain-containing protein [Planococcus dechangensis]|uniref:AbrB/MazE/SpoVT family DNA-binding domain-containing protein n=1 Tax=Planococcus dechangensis TaxID=1176255 RepID=A0ABV9M7F7_9BACL
MKSTGMVRKVDRLGRIVTPIELRRALNVTVGDELEIFVEGEKIVLSKYTKEKFCVITGEVIDEKTELNYLNGASLSPKGAAILLKELQDYRN